jgi:hypothetical protein
VGRCCRRRIESKPCAAKIGDRILSGRWVAFIAVWKCLLAEVEMVIAQEMQL